MGYRQNLKQPPYALHYHITKKLACHCSNLLFQPVVHLVASPIRCREMLTRCKLYAMDCCFHFILDEPTTISLALWGWRQVLKKSVPKAWYLLSLEQLFRWLAHWFVCVGHRRPGFGYALLRQAGHPETGQMQLNVSRSESDEEENYTSLVKRKPVHP